MANKRMTAKIYGAVQGVGFRATAKDKMNKLQLTGIARNEPDGTVYVVAEGDEEKLKELLKWCHKGPWLAKVEKVESEFSDA
jgi:acylphosphatase